MSARDWNWERQGPWLSALKAACAMLGLGNGRPAIAAILDEVGLSAAAGATRSR